MRTLLALLATSLVMLEGCGRRTETLDREKVMAAIQRAEEAQSAAYRRNDLNAAFASYTDDSTLYAPGSPPAHGRAAIRALNERAMMDPALKVVIDEASRRWWLAKSGDLATTTYNTLWTHTDAASGKPVTERVISQTTWLKQSDGSWKNVMDINGAYPAPTAPAE
jgi:ketosteroid isomerase-like protein